MANTQSTVHLESTDFDEVDLREGQSNEEISSGSSRSTCSFREILKNSWVKRLPTIEKKPGRFAKVSKPEKVWMVFCIHNNKEPFLEFYDNRRSAYSHNPIMSTLLINCLHISPSIYPQDDDDHEFVITLDTQVIRIAAASRDQMIEWMDTMRVKLREMGILEPKDNIYSKEPGSSARDDEMLPVQTEDQPSIHSELRHQQVRNPSSPLPPIPNIHDRRQCVNSSVTSTDIYDVTPSNPNITPAMQSLSMESQDVQDSPSSVFNFDFVADTLYGNTTQNASVEMSSRFSDNFASLNTSITNRAVSLPTSPSAGENSSLYEPLFFIASGDSPSPRVTLRGFRNPNYDSPPTSQQRRSDSEYLPYSSVASADFTSPHCSAPTTVNEHITARRQRTLRNAVSVSEPSLNIPCSISNSNLPSRRTSIGSLPENPSAGQSCNSRVQCPVSNFYGGHEHLGRISPMRAPPPPLEEGPPPYDGVPYSSSVQRHINHGSSSESPVCNEGGRQLSLKEAQVVKLQKEITHQSGVRLTLRKKDCVNAVALVECFSAIWIAGWKQKEHPLLHNTFHIGDRIVSIAGHKITNVQEAQKVIKHQALIVEFIVNRVPLGRVLAIKRQCDGQDLGIIRDGNTAEIKEVRPDGLAALHGLPPKALTVDGSDQCNWVLTEINHRPLNLFFKDNEVLDRLNAVGKDISILVQPIDLIRQLKKQLKLLRGYKDYIVQ